jgi:hypothetical protein
MRPFDQELIICKRYYNKTFGYGTPVGYNVGDAAGSLDGQVPSSNGAAFSLTWDFDVEMRVIPTFTTYNPNNVNALWRDRSNGTDANLGVSTVSQKRAMVYSPDLITVGHTLSVHATVSARL